MAELNSVTMRAAHGRMREQGLLAMERTITGLALAGERQAKINASTGAHRKGTPTPATRNVTGPARISGNLVRNITHDPTVRVGTDYVARVGVARGAPYGVWVEGLGYAFIKPVARFLRVVVTPGLVRAEFGKARFR